MSKSGHPGGIAGGLFALFDLIGAAFFFVLIGHRASQDSLRNKRVTFGSILFCTGVSLLFFWHVSWFDSAEPSERLQFIISSAIVAGLLGGGLLALILVGYVESIDREERRRRREEERRGRLIAQGKDPDKHCFIASFAFDGPSSPEVVRLRSWRDAVLIESKVGLALAGAYHRMSPHVVRLLMPYLFLKRPIRWLLRVFMFVIRA